MRQAFRSSIATASANCPRSVRCCARANRKAIASRARRAVASNPISLTILRNLAARCFADRSSEKNQLMSALTRVG